MRNTCGHDVDPEAWLCPECSALVERFAATQTIPAPAQGIADIEEGTDSREEAPALCPQPWCGQPIPAGACRCPYCDGQLAAMCATVVLPGGLRIPVEGTLILGRASPDPRVRGALEAIKTVGRQHAELACVEGELTIRDLDSLNGTWLDGVEVVGLVRVGLSRDVFLGLGRQVILILTKAEGH